MAFRCRWISACGLLLLAATRALAANPSETEVFQAVAQEFQHGFYEQADRDFADFVQKYPSSSHLPDAILYQAEAKYKLGKYDDALKLLTAHQAAAGGRSDEYLFWSGEAAFQKGDFRHAADTFAKLAKDFPTSVRRLEAVVRGATALARLAEWPNVIGVLGDTNGVFQTAATTNASELAIRGRLLLAEAHFALRAFPAATAALAPLRGATLDPKLDWERQYLLSRISLATDHPEAALESSTNLLSLATAAGDRGLQAETVAFQAGVLERLGRPVEALTVYQRNLAEGVPAERQRQALAKITELSLAQNKVDEAADMLERFLAQSPSAETTDLALLTLAELRLRQFQAYRETMKISGVSTNLSASTNHVQQALVALQTFTNRFPRSPLYGKCQLDLGWCFWLDGKGPESQAAFQAALERLPVSIDQAIAQFKLGDAQLQQRNYSVAITNYSAVLDKFAGLPDARTNLFEQVLSQLVRAGLKAGNLPVATNALFRLLKDYPEGRYTDSAVLLAGQEIARRDPIAARQLLSDFAKLAPQAARVPDIELAVARTYEQEGQWPKAIEQYDLWLATFTNHAARPRALYDCARANFQAGRETNALTILTNLVASYPRNDLVPLAQWWVGDYYYGVANFEDAERNYQSIYQSTNGPTRELRYQALMMAGRSAFARQGWKDAKDYFGRLAGNTNCPLDLRAQAFFALADTLLSQGSTNDYTEAISALDQVRLQSPSNELAVLALGGKANCLLQSGEYRAASNLFQKVIESPLARVRTRASASIGLAITLEKMAQQETGTNQTALLEMALNECLKVFYYGKFLRPGETPDEFWTIKAGMESARLADRLQLREAAMNVRRTLKELFPLYRGEEKLNAQFREAEPIPPR